MTTRVWYLASSSTNAGWEVSRVQRNRFHASSQEARSETFRLAADLCVLGLVGPNPGTEGGNRGEVAIDQTSHTYPRGFGGSGAGGVEGHS